ncbi:MAG: Protease HtpX [Verrucomicrobiota bacterium]|jgi:Zn-dependent protease with chaperone function
MSAADYSRCACQFCNGHIEFPNEAVGAVVACPHCQQPVTLVMDDALPSPDSSPPGALTPAQIAAAFNGTFPKTRVSVFYQLGLIIVAITTIIMPLIYFALVGTVGWCVYWWATHGTFLFQGTRGRTVVWGFMLYAALLFAGVVVTFFMFKPFLARRAPAAQPLALSPTAEPVLFALVRCICDAVGAPFPNRIDVDCQLNAAASFRRGLRSFFGNDLVLTVGMPLVAGMNARQFAGILAHEFGHFTQGFGMRLTYLIRTINAWFARIAYERDAWDATLEQWQAEAEDGRLAIFIGIVQLSVWFTRLFLKLLLFISHAIGCFMLRQMEYDADSYEIKLAGSDAFESAALRLRVLSAALDKSYKDIRVGWNNSKRLPDNFPSYLMSHEVAMRSEAKQQLEDTAGLSKTGLFDSHPSDGDRIRQARRAGEPGVFDLDLPATALFSNFDVLAKQVTQLHYAEDMGVPLVMATLCPVEPGKPPAQ